jgi:hypothetical protein
MSLSVTPSRRLTSRIEAHDDVWVYWECNGRADVSRVRDVSLGGVFIKTPKTIPEATSADVYFLVEEGQIRADAVVRHTKPNTGLGLKFLAVNERDRARLAALVTRLQSLSRSG